MPGCSTTPQAARCSPLISHTAEGTIETSTLWQSSADTTWMTWLYGLVWCDRRVGLLVFNRRF
jgi:hypothetical protein